jgi:hypothetical protein
VGLATALAMGTTPGGVATLGAATVVGMVITTAQPADAASRKKASKKKYRGYHGRHYGSRRSDSSDMNYFVPEGMYTGYPNWARSAFAPKR